MCVCQTPRSASVSSAALLLMLVRRDPRAIPHIRAAVAASSSTNRSYYVRSTFIRHHACEKKAVRRTEGGDQLAPLHHHSIGLSWALLQGVFASPSSSRLFLSLACLLVLSPFLLGVIPTSQTKRSHQTYCSLALFLFNVVVRFGHCLFFASGSVLLSTIQSTRQPPPQHRHQTTSHHHTDPTLPNTNWISTRQLD